MQCLACESFECQGLGHMVLGVGALRFRVQGSSAVRVWGLGLEYQGFRFLGCSVCVVCTVWGVRVLGFRVKGSRVFRVQGVGIMVQC